MTLSVAKVIAEYASGRCVNLPVLAKFGFRKPLYVWGGQFDLATPDGQVWSGLGAPGRLINVDGLDQSATLESSQIKITFSGADASMMKIATSENRADYVNKLLIVYGLFCDANWQPLAVPMALAAGLIGDMQVSRQLQDDVWQRTIVLPADNIFYGRGCAPASYYTDIDQQQRFPGDLGCSFIASLQDTDIPVPWH